MNIELQIDSTLIKNKTFSKTKFVPIVKQDIFNYGIFKHPIPPEKIGENEFEYLQSKIPSYFNLYDDLIDFQEDKKRIISKVSGEDLKNLSEIIGIAVGLKSAETILNLKKQDFKKITESQKRLKRLDFRTTLNNKVIEIETKGTSYSKNVNQMIKDIHNKKGAQTKHNKNSNVKYGFITLLQASTDNGTAKIFATDPDVDSTFEKYKGIYIYIDYYLIYFSFILDNMEYNKLVKKLHNGKKYYQKQFINTKKLQYKLAFGDKVYYGQCFDKRLIMDAINKYYVNDDTVAKLFKKLTNEIGKEKYFLGMDLSIINSLNNYNVDYLQNYKSDNIYKNEENINYIQMSDGLLFVKSTDGQLKEIEGQFTEDDVKKRLGELFGYNLREPHQCGAPCRSREIEGKPCEIMTYRENCHFHR